MQDLDYDAPRPDVHIQSYLRFRDLLEAAPDAIFEVDRDGTIVLMNAAAERIFGYNRDELLGKFIEVLVPDSIRARHQEHRSHYEANPLTRPMGIGLELFAKRRDGTHFPVEISLSPIRAGEGSRVIAVVRDISARKLSEAQINAMHEQFASELAATNQQLEIRNHEVERADRLKSEFLASMSHELRTPLHTVIGFADLLSEEVKGPLNADQKRFIAHIQRDSRHLLELINDILDLSKIEAGRLELNPEVFNACDAIVETLSGLRPLAANKKLDIVEALDCNLTITADRVRFKEILYNLVSNSIKFTPEGGRIEVECSRRADLAFFAVTDSGIGIAKSEQKAIFDKFYQTGSTTRGVREGTGLGLAITKSLVEMHDGTISLQSSLGQGSRFEFVLPNRAARAGGVDLKRQADPVYSVLLVAALGDSRERMVRSLLENGFQVICAATTEEARKLTHENQLSAVLIDLSALGADSWRFMRQLRADQTSASMPIIAMATAQDDGNAASLGADSILVKPVEPYVLLKTIRSQIEPSPGQPSRVLVVDDESEARELLNETLSSAGFLPVLATSGKQGLELLARGPIHAVVVDLMMPEMSGFEFILRVRQNPAFSKLPIVVLTAKEIDDDDLSILSREANAVFLKGSPWRDGFLAKIADLLRNITTA
jgi:PAS domain S-box-containing protein